MIQTHPEHHDNNGEVANGAGKEPAPLSAVTSEQRTLDRIGFSSLVMNNSRNLALTLVIIASYMGQTFHVSSTTDQHPEAVLHLANDSSLQSVYHGAWAIACYFLLRLLLVYPVSVQLWKVTRLLWQESASNHADSLFARVTSSQTMTRIRSSVSNSSVRNLMSLCQHRQPKQIDHSLVISAKDCFLPLNVIEQLTLCDIKDLFRFILDVRKSGFDRRAFVSSLPSNSILKWRGVLDAMDQVTAESSGGVSVVSATHEEDEDSHCDDKGDVDALYFCAVVRIFAEWRSLRLVPPQCNQRYAIGMNLARRDLIHNVQKMEMAAHGWLVHHLQQHEIPLPTRPTLRQILKFERQEQNLHPYLPRVTDKSGASGLLWTKRQLWYQTRSLANIAQIPYRFDDSRSAVTAAYQATYQAYHGFIVKQIFQSSFEAAPEAQVILHYMNLPVSSSLDAETVAEDHEWSDLDEDDDAMGVEGEDDAWIQLPVEESDGSVTSPTRDRSANALGHAWPTAHVQDHHRLHPHPNASENPLEHVGSFLEEHWTKLQKLVGQCVGIQVDSNPYRNVMEAQVGSDSTNDEDAMTNKETLHTVDNVIPSYLAVLQPLLEQLDRLMDEFNMNDHTKI